MIYGNTRLSKAPKNVNLYDTCIGLETASLVILQLTHLNNPMITQKT